jgi:hypothetical protein
LRLLQQLASIDRSRGLPLFVSLTYPGGTWPDDPAVWHDHLERFYKRLCRRFPAWPVALVWRMEPQKRGAPHFHLLIFGVSFLPATWVGEVCAARCSRVERVRTWRGVMSYAAKYLGKVANAEASFLDAGGAVLAEVGRHWGVKGRANLPVTWVRYSLLLSQFHQVRRILANYVRSLGRRHQVRGRYGGLWCFLPADEALRLVGAYAPGSGMSYARPKL